MRRNIGIYQHYGGIMKGDRAMEILVPLGILVLWILLQAWILPRMGVKT